MPFVQRNMLQILYDWLKLSGGSLVGLYFLCAFWAYYAFSVLSRKFLVKGYVEHIAKKAKNMFGMTEMF